MILLVQAGKRSYFYEPAWRRSLKGRNYDVLLLRPQDNADAVDMSKAIDLVEQGYREARDFPLINARAGGCIHERT